MKGKVKIDLEGQVLFEVFDIEGRLKDSQFVQNVITGTMLDNIVSSFLSPTTNPCSGFDYIALGEGTTPETINDLALEDEFTTADFGDCGSGNEYGTRIDDYNAIDLAANTYIISGTIINCGPVTLSVNESGIYDGPIPGVTGDELACRVVVDDTIYLSVGEELRVRWEWTVNSA